LTVAYAHYYLVLSMCSTLLFGCSVLNLGPLAYLSPLHSTVVVIALFTALTLAQSKYAR
jgi:hypothetical protein